MGRVGPRKPRTASGLSSRQRLFLGPLERSTGMSPGRVIRLTLPSRIPEGYTTGSLTDEGPRRLYRSSSWTAGNS